MIAFSLSVIAEVFTNHHYYLLLAYPYPHSNCVDRLVSNIKLTRFPGDDSVVTFRIRVVWLFCVDGVLFLFFHRDNSLPPLFSDRYGHGRRGTNFGPRKGKLFLLHRTPTFHILHNIINVLTYIMLFIWNFYTDRVYTFIRRWY